MNLAILNLASSESQEQLHGDRLKQIFGGGSMTTMIGKDGWSVQAINANIRIDLIPGQPPKYTIINPDGTIKQIG